MVPRDSWSNVTKAYKGILLHATSLQKLWIQSHRLHGAIRQMTPLLDNTYLAEFWMTNKEAGQGKHNAPLAESTLPELPHGVATELAPIRIAELLPPERRQEVPLGADQRCTDDPEPCPAPVARELPHAPDSAHEDAQRDPALLFDWQTSLQVQTDMICTLDRSMQPHCAELENWRAFSGRPWGFATSGHVPAHATAEDVLAELAPGGWGGVGGAGLAAHTPAPGLPTEAKYQPPSESARR